MLRVDLSVRIQVPPPVPTHQPASLGCVLLETHFLHYSKLKVMGLSVSLPFLLEAVKKNRYSLRYASAELQGDREIVLHAVKKNGNELEYASAALQGDREIVLHAVKSDGDALEYASASLQGDREIVLHAVKQKGYSLFYASAALKGDHEIVLEAVKQNGGTLEYASAEYQSDPEFIRASYLSSAVALKYSKGIHSYDPMFIFECLNRDARGLFYLNRTEKKDLFNKFSSDLRRRIDYLSSVLGNSDEDYFFDDNQDYVSGDELEKIIDVRYLEFIEKTQKRALNELADMFSCELFYDDKRKNDLHKQLQMCEESEVGATIASYLSVKEAVSTMRVCKTSLFIKGLSDEEDRGNANKYRKIND